MRQQNSLFNKVVEFINNTKVGDTYRVSDLIAYAGPHEVTTWYKKSNGNPNYRIRSYQTMLKGPFLKNVKRGEWKVLQHIPEWFDLGHGTLMNSWYRYDKNDNRILTYKGLTRNELLAKLGKPVYTDAPKVEEFTMPLGDAIPLGNAFSATVNNMLNDSFSETVKVMPLAITDKMNNLLKEQPKPEQGTATFVIPTQNEKTTWTTISLMKAAAELAKIHDKDLLVNARVVNIMAQITQLSNELK